MTTGNESFSLGLSNGISEIMESVAKAIKDPYSTISSEDMLARFTEYNENLEKIKTKIEMLKEQGCEDCEIKTLEKEISNLTLIGNDVVALYPSLTSERTGKIVREMVEESTIKFEGLDDKMARAYIRINEDMIEDEVIAEIEHLLPKRTSKNGTKPTMSSINPKWDPENQWIFPETIPTEKELKKIVGLVVEIALRTLFDNFTYKFGGRFYHQRAGGPIGVRATGAAAQLVMELWARCYKKILERSGIIVHLMGGYVDDGRQISTSLEMGMRFDEGTEKFEFSEKALEEDEIKKDEGETNNARMARICKDAMNHVNKDLKFTTETQEEFNHERLPTLDFEVWMNAEGVVKHSYFQKPMKTPYVIMARSAMASHQKYQILSNELTRRISNINTEVVEHKEVLEKIEEFTKELKTSEYTRKQAKEIVVSGIRAWKKRILKRKRENQPFYRPAKMTVKERMMKEIVEKESWYKDRNEEESDEEESPRKKIKLNQENVQKQKIPKTIQKNIKNFKNIKKIKNKTSEGEKTTSVIFVPHTENSELAKQLKEGDKKIRDITGNKIKVVERCGVKLKDLLTGKDPWKGKDCGRENCFICATKLLTGKNLTSDCTSRNVVYEIKCITCEKAELARIVGKTSEEKESSETTNNKNIPTAKYIGETSRSGYERGLEHLDKLASLSSQSHMLKHMLDKHEDTDFSEVQWGMSILGKKRSAFERQITEAVTIMKESKKHDILNSKAEWSQCSLPRLTSKMGDKDLKEMEKEIRIEKDKESKFEEKVRKLRKERNRARLHQGGNTASKRQKINAEEYISIREVWGPPERNAPGKK